MAERKAGITVALDGTGGDTDRLGGIVRAAEFALTLYPAMRLIVFGSRELERSLKKARTGSRCQFRLAPECIPQDEAPFKVLEGYRDSAMRKAVEAVRDGEAQAVISAGGTGPLVALSRHILGTLGRMRPALCARIPAGEGRFSLMLDLGANARSSAADLLSFAKLGTAAARVMLKNAAPAVSVLNLGSELCKGNRTVLEARDLIASCRGLHCGGFVEANQLFTGDTDIIVTDGFTGNVALKAAEGVARIIAHGPGMKRFFARLAFPQWLAPWQYNGSLLLGVKGTVVKSHASARQEALAVAIVEAARAVEAGLTEKMAADPLLLQPSQA